MRKVLFVVFRHDECALMHALWYGKDLTGRGHTVKVILEGEATRFLEDERLVGEIKGSGLVAGVCKTASRAMGCSKDAAVLAAAAAATVAPLHEIANRAGIPLLDGMHGHASIGEFFDQGFELVTF